MDVLTWVESASDRAKDAADMLYILGYGQQVKDKMTMIKTVEEEDVLKTIGARVR